MTDDSFTMSTPLLKIDLNDAESINYYKNLLNKMHDIVKDLNSINSKGFVTELNFNKLPFIKEVIDFLGPLAKIEDERLEKCYEEALALARLEGTDLKRTDFDFENKYAIKGKVDNYEYWLNLILLNLYKYCGLINIYIEEIIKNTDDNASNTCLNKSVEAYDDLKNDFLNISLYFYNLLHPSIREKIQKKGITVLQNIYTGFDCEFVLEKPTYNHLLSVQLALNTRLIIKLPKYTKFSLSDIHPLTGEIYLKKNVSKHQIILENSLSSCIDDIRLLKFRNNDHLINTLIEGLRNDPHIKDFENDKHIVFSLPLTPIETYIYYNENNKGYTFSEMVEKSLNMSKPYLIQSYDNLVKTIWQIIFNDNPYPNHLEDVPLNENNYNIKNIKNVSKIDDFKTISRTSLTFTGDKISVTRIVNNYFTAHLTNADLSILDDFNELKEKLDIVNKSFITLGKPLRIKGLNVYIRDTMLLAPAGKKSLESIGSLYPESPKIYLSKEDKQRMDLLLKRDPLLFENYAIRDSIITLKHANSMENFNFELKGIGIPTTLSSLGHKYVIDKWKSDKYEGYQISNSYLLGDTSRLITPKGLNNSETLTKISLILGMFVANYKGGRNESFMYGVDFKTIWYDYDFVSAYTTAMACLGNPVYKQLREFKGDSEALSKIISEFSDDKLIYNYFLIEAKFLFPEETKFPSIPCFVDQTTTVYPMTGDCFLTGPEFVLAKNQGCKLTLKRVIMIPFERNGEGTLDLVNQPFFTIIDEIQKKRLEHEKGTISNLLFKEMGNSIYGNVVRGMGDKRKYDIKTGKMLRIEPTTLSNPILASWTTAFIRSVIGECLHNLSKLNGRVVSVTTDGFICDVENLEDLLLNSDLLKESDTILLRVYRDIRSKIVSNPSALELKNMGAGIISWSTRGQLGIESRIKATTGFQVMGLTKIELVNMFVQTLKSDVKNFEFIASNLRGAKEIYKKGGHVTMTYKDQFFSLNYDNRRVILISDNDVVDASENLYDSKPLPNVDSCKQLRILSKLPKNKLYNRLTSKKSGNVYKNYIDIASRNFLKGLLAADPLYGFDLNSKKVFKSYTDISKFLESYDPKLKMSKSAISNLKNRKSVVKPVIRNNDTVNFVNFIKKRFPYFDDSSFFS